jgi:hypothetical protein
MKRIPFISFSLSLAHIIAVLHTNNIIITAATPRCLFHQRAAMQQHTQIYYIHASLKENMRAVGKLFIMNYMPCVVGVPLDQIKRERAREAKVNRTRGAVH